MTNRFDRHVAMVAGAEASAEPRAQASMVMIEDAQHPERADPKYWAPFVVVGEPAKPAN